MPALDNPKHETFAVGLAKGLSQASAYKAAGFNGAASNASTLARSAPVKARVAELHAEARGRISGIQAVRHIALEDAREESPVTAHWLKLELMQIVIAARESENFKDALAGIELGAKLIGIDLEEGQGKNKSPADAESRNRREAILSQLAKVSERMVDVVGDDPAKAIDLVAQKSSFAPSGDGAVGDAEPVRSDRSFEGLGSGPIYIPAPISGEE